MDEIISYKMCAVKVRNAKLRNYLKRVLYVIKNAKFSKTVRYISLFCAVTYVEILRNVLHELHQAIGFLRVIFVSVCCHSNELCVTKTDINLKKKHQNRCRSCYLLHKT